MGDDKMTIKKRTWVWALAILMALTAVVFVLVARGGNDAPPDKTTTTALTDETTTPAATAAEDPTEEAATGYYYHYYEIAYTQPEDDTTAEATTSETRTPETLAEIVAFYNDAANRVKTQRLGFSQTDRTHIDSDAIVIHNRALNAVAGSVLTFAERWMDWSEPVVVPRGACHNDFFVAGQSWSSRLQPAWVQSATLTPRGGDYHIRIVLRDERVPYLPVNQTTTRHGQVMKVFTQAEISDEAGLIPGIDVQEWNALYTGSYVEAIVCAATGNMKHARFFINSQVDMQIRVTVGTFGASMPLSQEYVFTLNYR